MAYERFISVYNQNRLTCMQGQKTLKFSYNMHLFLPYLLQTPPLRDSNLGMIGPIG